MTNEKSTSTRFADWTRENGKNEKKEQTLLENIQIQRNTTFKPNLRLIPTSLSSLGIIVKVYSAITTNLLTTLRDFCQSWC